MRYLNDLLEYFDECAKSESSHYVVWSGGADSTCLLMLLCQALSKAKSRKHINVLSVKSDVILGRMKSKKEAEARQKILAILQYKYDVIIDVHETTINYDGKNDPAKNTGLPQAALWAMTTLPYIPNNSNIYFGYIRGDDLVYYKDTFLKTLKDMIKLIGKEEISIEIPLIMYSKSDIFTLLKKEKLLDYIWTCEMPTADGEPCGCCVPCGHYIEAMFISEMDDMTAREKQEILPAIMAIKDRSCGLDVRDCVIEDGQIVDVQPEHKDTKPSPPPLPSCNYRHFKGDEYKIVCVAEDTTDNMPNHGHSVVYQSVRTGKFYTREYNEFLSPVDKDKYPDVEQQDRFQPI